MDRHSQSAQVQSDIRRICEIAKNDTPTTECIVDLTRLLSRYPTGTVAKLINNVLKDWGISIQAARDIAKSHWAEHRQPKNQLARVEYGSGADAP